MYINTNVSALNAHRNLFGNDNQMSKTMEKLSSGYRINRAADDAAGLAISEKMRSLVGGYDQAQRNAQDGVSLLQTAEGALTEVHSMLQRMNTLATQSANGTYEDATDRAALDAEFSQLVAEIENIATSTEFNGINLLDGSAAATLDIQIGAKSGDKLAIDIAAADSTTATLGIDASTIATSADADTAITAIQTAIDTVSSTRADLGAYQNRLEHTINNLGVASENLSASESRIRDADMAKEMTNFTKQQILVQAGTAMLAQANSKPQSVLQLLG